MALGKKCRADHTNILQRVPFSNLLFFLECVFVFSLGQFASYLRHFGAKISDLPVFSLHFGTTISHFGTKISHAHSICSISELESQIWEAKIKNLNGSCNI